MKIIFSYTYMGVFAIKLHLEASCDVHGVMEKVWLIFEDGPFDQNGHLWRHYGQNSVKIQPWRSNINLSSIYMDVVAIKLHLKASYNMYGVVKKVWLNFEHCSLY